MQETLDYQELGSPEGSTRSIKEVLANGHNLSMREALKTAWGIYTKGIGLYIGYTIVFILISVVTMIIPILGILTYIFFLGPVLFVGFFIVSNLIYQNEDYGFGNFFDGFRAKLGTIALNTLIIFGLYILLLVPFIVFFGSMFTGVFKSGMNPSMNPMDFYGNLFSSMGAGIIGILIYYFFLLFCGSLLLFNYQLLLFQNTNAWDSIVISAKITLIKYWKYLIAYIISIAVTLPISLLVGKLGMGGLIIYFIFVFCMFSFYITCMYAFYALIFKKE